MSAGDTELEVEPPATAKRHGVLWQVYNSANDFNFIKTFRWGLIVGALICVLSILSLFTRELNLGIDFEGGSVWEVESNGVSIEDARDVMADLGQSGAKIQEVKNEADDTESL